jgi:CRISPR/Cas system-associated protein Cas7 (RAMP superfamily)
LTKASVLHYNFDIKIGTENYHRERESMATQPKEQRTKESVEAVMPLQGRQLSEEETR